MVNPASSKTDAADFRASSNRAPKQADDLIVDSDRCNVSKVKVPDPCCLEGVSKVIVGGSQSAFVDQGHREDETPIIGIAIVEPEGRSDSNTIPIELAQQTRSGFDLLVYQLR
jgi:hypothetical protein